MSSSPRSFVVPDHRKPGRPMATLPVKVPADTLEELQALADSLQCNRGALARALLLHALGGVQEAAAVGEANWTPSLALGNLPNIRGLSCGYEKTPGWQAEGRGSNKQPL